MENDDDVKKLIKEIGINPDHTSAHRQAKAKFDMHLAEMSNATAEEVKKAIHHLIEVLKRASESNDVFGKSMRTLTAVLVLTAIVQAVAAAVQAFAAWKSMGCPQ